MARVALDTLILGDHGEIHAGQEIPATYTVGGDGPRDTDFEHLEAAGLVEPVKAKRAAKSEE